MSRDGVGNRSHVSVEDSEYILSAFKRPTGFAGEQKDAWDVYTYSMFHNQLDCTRYVESFRRVQLVLEHTVQMKASFC